MCHEVYPCKKWGPKKSQRFTPMPSMMADRESVLLEVINTKHKKNAGSLRLLSNNLIWIPHGSDNPKLSCAYSEIKGKIPGDIRFCKILTRVTYKIF